MNNDKLTKKKRKPNKKETSKRAKPRKIQARKPKKKTKKQEKRAYPRNSITLDMIDFERVFDLAAYQSSKREIYAIMNICETELLRAGNEKYNEQFNKFYLAGKEAGKNDLRLSQFKMARKNAAMAIFLGKQYLGQSDNPNQLISADLGTVKVEFVEGANKDQDQKKRIEEMEQKLKEEIK